MKQGLQNQLGNHTAHLQVHRSGYHDNPDIDLLMAKPDMVDSALAQEPRLKAASRRMLTPGLLSSARNSSGVMFVGVEPVRERLVTTIASSIVAGRNIEQDPHEILVSERLAKTLDVTLGDKLVAMSSTRDGQVGSELFRIVGLYRTHISEFDRFHVYIPLPSARSLIHAPGMVAEFAAIADQGIDIRQVRDDLRTALGPEYEVLSYEDVIPTLVMQVELTEQSMLIYYVIIGIAMIFGIINTMMMSVYERINEFGVLKAVGMKDLALFRLVLTEAALLGVVGTSLGILVGSGVTLYVEYTGINFAWFAEGLSSWGTGAIVHPEFRLSSVLVGSMVIVAMCVMAAVHPAYRAIRLQPVEAIRHV
jgi:ABC-type lipoprotein release transport system permease subunit